MLIKIQPHADRYMVSFAGKRHQFNEYINKVMSVEEKEYDYEKKSWVFDEQGIERVKNMFNMPPAPSVLPTATKSVTNYEDIGASMKLQPYVYQKEAIKYILDNQEALLVLPCGAGRVV